MRRCCRTCAPPPGGWPATLVGAGHPNHGKTAKLVGLWDALLDHSGNNINHTAGRDLPHFPLATRPHSYAPTLSLF